MEDILQSGYQDLSMIGDDSDNEDGQPSKMSRRPSAVSAKSAGSRPASAYPGEDEDEHAESKFFVPSHISEMLTSIS